MSDFDIYPQQKYVYPLATMYPHGVRITAAHTSRNATLVVKHWSPRNGRRNNLRAYVNAPQVFGEKKGRKKNEQAAYQCIHEIYLLYKKISYSCTTVHLQ